MKTKMAASELGTDLMTADGKRFKVPKDLNYLELKQKG
jgi:hypothetical protein